MLWRDQLLNPGLTYQVVIGLRQVSCNLKPALSHCCLMPSLLLSWLSQPLMMSYLGYRE